VNWVQQVQDSLVVTVPDSSIPEACALSTKPRCHHESSLPELCIVIPTYNECGSVEPLISGLKSALSQINWEATFVDDNSPDGTADRVRQIAGEDQRIRIIQRADRDGLASACITGMRAASAQYIAVMDADLQHDEGILPEMLLQMKSAHADIVIASRKTRGGSMGELPALRRCLSNLGSWLSRIVFRDSVSDPMSGFFLVNREFFALAAPHLAGRGFKILLDMLSSSPRPVSFVEIPYSFRKRQHGESKLGFRVGMEYVHFVVSRSLHLKNRCRKRRPTRTLNAG
jgi:dolichol-phosphate mannosyltransferase